MMTYHNDRQIKIDYDPTLNVSSVAENAIGATTSLTLRTLDFTPSDVNSVYVEKTGSDSTGDGTAANPFLTIKHAMTAVTATKCNIVIADSGTYIEESMAIDTDCARIVAAIGQTPVIQPALIHGSSFYHFDTKLDTTALTATTGAATRYSGVAALSNGNFVILYDRNGSNYYTYFIIVDKNGSVVIPETVVASSNAVQGTVCSLESGYFVLAYRNPSSNLINYYVYDNSGTLHYSDSSVACLYGEVNVGRVGGYDDRFVICYTHTSNYTFFFVADINGVQYVAPKQLSTYRCHDRGSIVPKPGGGFIYSFRISTLDDNRWCVVDGSGTILNDAQVLAGYRYCAGSLTDNGILFACGDVSGNVSLIEYSLNTYAVITPSQTIYTDAAVDMNEISLVKMSDNNYALAVWTYQSGTGYTVRLLLIQNNWTLLSSETFTNYVRSMCAYNSYSDRLCVSMISVTSPYSPTINIKSGFLTDWWTASSSLLLNGINFESNDCDYIYRLIYISAGTFTMRWCELNDFTRIDYADDDYPLYPVISAGSANVVANCKVFNCDAGFKFTSDAANVSWSQFYHNIVNPSIYVDGDGTGVIVNHCDFLFCRIGVYLLNNAGTEVIKNSIFYQALLYSIQAEAAVVYTNSVNSSPVSNATAGALVVLAHPHYVNDGYVTYANLDLRLKSRVLGYKFDSPALLIGDDTENAGSVQIDTSGTTQTWTSITVSKDKVSFDYEPVLGNEIIYRDGSVDSSRDSYVEVLQLQWSALINADLENLLDVIFCEKDQVRVYLDPVTHPATYAFYKVIFDKAHASPAHFRLSRTGAEGFSLTLKRGYNEGA